MTQSITSLIVHSLMSILVATVVLTGIGATTGGVAAQSTEPTPTLTCGTETYDVEY